MPSREEVPRADSENQSLAAMATAQFEAGADAIAQSGAAVLADGAQRLPRYPMMGRASNVVLAEDFTAIEAPGGSRPFPGSFETTALLRFNGQGWLSTPDVNLLDADVAHLVQSNPWAGVRGNVKDLGVQPDGFGAVRFDVTADDAAQRMQVSGLSSPWSADTANFGITITADSGNVSTPIVTFFITTDVEARMTTGTETIAPGESKFLSDVRFVADMVGTVLNGVWINFTTAAIGDLFTVSKMIANADGSKPSAFIPSLRIVGDLDTRVKLSVANWIVQGPYLSNYNNAGDGFHAEVGSLGVHSRQGDNAGGNKSGWSSIGTPTPDVPGTIRQTWSPSSGELDTYFDDALTNNQNRGGGGALGANLTVTLNVGKAGWYGAYFTGDIYSAEVRDGIDGPIVASFDALYMFKTLAVDGQTFVDLKTGRIWTIHGEWDEDAYQYINTKTINPSQPIEPTP